MACATLHFHSPTLLKACSMTVLVPEGSVGTPPFPVCISSTVSRTTTRAGHARRASSATLPALP